MRFMTIGIPGCFVAFVLSAFVGKTLIASCTTDCKEGTCFQGPEDASYDCIRLDTGSCFGNAHVRDASGGTCMQSQAVTYFAHCPDCNPECPNAPSEASDCSPALTPGCDPGVDCCESTGSALRLICDLGTP